MWINYFIWIDSKPFMAHSEHLGNVKYKYKNDLVKLLSVSLNNYN